MARKRLIWYVLPAFLAVTLLAAGGLTIYVLSSAREFYVDELAQNLEQRARLVDYQIAGFSPGHYAEVKRSCDELRNISDARVTVILPSGLVIGDTNEDPALMDNHGTRPEIVEAYSGVVGRSIRYSKTVKQQMMYVAVPAMRNGTVAAVVRTSLPLRFITGKYNRLRMQIISGAVVIGFIIFLISYVLSKSITLPIEKMRVAAERFARGDFNYRVLRAKAAEICELGDSMNWMASQLDEKIQKIESQREEHDAVMASMVEGLLAVDMRERIIRMNRAAAELLDANQERDIGRPLQEITRNLDLENIVKTVLQSSKPVEEEILMPGADGDRYLQGHGSPLRDTDGMLMGALIVLNDVTRLRRLEKVRRDFVGNVSHELKTPITSIKGFAETLEAHLTNEQDRRFAQIISKQSDRLSSIIQDLLMLSRLENEGERTEISFSDVPVRGELEAAVELCAPRAESCGVEVRIKCGDTVKVRGNAALLEQAIVNVLDNALKFSESGKHVDLRVVETDNEVEIVVEDSGCGIRKEHIPRLFERFYRVDKARSRELGGTGLGLAIVKHIAKAHGGRVTVESEVGKGSRFAIMLPRA
ncbi:MAG: PAS domain-containing protein [Verrucomicrobia bacterium]|nr:PAS domain-containing protein [Verrucomicrobiota bacterium]